jgi:hypothetical protein
MPAVNESDNFRGLQIPAVNELDDLPQIPNQPNNNNNNNNNNGEPALKRRRSGDGLKSQALSSYNYYIQTARPAIRQTVRIMTNNVY